MKRTTSESTGLSLADFIVDNRRLLIFLTRFLCGTLGGVMIFVACHEAVTEELQMILQIGSVGGSFLEAASSLLSSCFFTLLMLAVLFLTGLSACGAPVTILVPLFFGLGVGMTEAYYYAGGAGGILFTALFILPHSLVSAAALLMGCSESLRMTLLISGQLLPSVHCGGLWQDFKLYCTRFLIFAGIAFAAGVVDILLRLFFLRWFQ